MSDSEIDASLLELFREEVRGQVQVLNEGLVELERDPDPRRVESLMRAAHSIKGAARLVGVDPAVKLAHVMEDCLVAAQQGRLTLSASGIDALLAGSDWLAKLGEAAGGGFSAWFEPHREAVQSLGLTLERVLQGEELAAAISDAPASDSESRTEHIEEPTSSRIPAENIAWKVSLSEGLEPSVLELYRREVVESLLVFQEISAIWVSRPLTGDEAAKLQQAVKTLRGASLLINAEPAAEAARALEGAIQSMHPAETRLDEARRTALAQAAALQMELSECAGEAYHEIAPSFLPRLDAAFAALAQFAPLPRVKPEESRPAGGNLASNAPRAKQASPPPAKPQSEPIKNSPVAKKEAAAEPEDAQERVVRVTAKNLTRLMGLAGESLVEARWLQPFAQSLLNLKREQDRLGDIVDELAQSIVPINFPAGLALVKEVRNKLAQTRQVLGSRIEEFESHARRSDDLNSCLYNEVIASRMRPMSDGVQGYSRMVRDIARQLGKSVRFEIVGETTPVDRDVLEKLDAPLNHLLRNALDHGIESPEERLAAGKPETATLRLEARHSAGMFAITISDDGRGIDLEKLRVKIVERKLTTAEMAARMTDAELYEFLFLPGFSTRGQVTELSGRGVGLDVVHTMAVSVGGSVRVQSQLGKGTNFHLQLPITLSVIRAVLVDIAGEPYAFPLNRIDRLLRVPPDSIGSAEHRQFLRVDGQNVGVVLGTQILRMTKRPVARAEGEAVVSNVPEDLFMVLFSNHADQYGLLVDGFLGEQDLVVLPLDHRLGKVPNVSAAAVLDDGSPALIIDVDDVRRAIERLLETGKLERTDEGSGRSHANRKKRVLVVDDSITVREVERQLLTSRGYEVSTAVDGADGWNLIREEQFDLVISDIDVPRMNGLEFTRKIKDDTQLARVPVVIVSYKDREEDRLKGLEAGADYYLTKSSFHDESLMEAVQTLIGDAS